MDPVTIAGIIAAMNTLGKLFGANQASNQQQWANSALVDVLNWARASQGQGLDLALGAYNPLNDYARQAMGWGREALFNPEAGLVPWMQFQGQDAYQRAQNAAWNPDRGMYMGPEALNAMSQYDAQRAAIDPYYAALNELISPEGLRSQINPLQQIAFGRAQGLAPEQIETSNVLNELFNQRGQTNVSREAANRYFDIARQPYSDQMSNIQALLGPLLANQGYTQPMTDVQNSLLGNITGGEFGIGGLTPTGATIEGVALDTLLRGGESPTTRYLTGRGANLASENPLLPMETVASMARNEAYTRGAQAGQAARRQAFARGGGPGMIGGNQYDALAEFNDDILRQGASAVQAAMQARQQMGLQQLSTGLEAVRSGGGLAAGRESAAYGGGGDIERTATQRYGTSLSGFDQLLENALSRYGMGVNTSQNLEQLALQRMLGTGNLAMEGIQNENARLGTAANLTNLYNQMLTGGMGSYADMLKLNADLLGGGVNSYGTLANLGRGLTSDAWNTYLGQQGQNLARLGSDYSGMNYAMNWLQNPMQSWQDYMNRGTGYLGQMGSNWINYAMAGLGQANMRGIPGPENFWSNLFPSYSYTSSPTGSTTTIGGGRNP